MNELSEGAGSQAFQIMRAINFARASGLVYLHSPFTHIAHGDRPMQEWVAAWEKVFNFGAYELPFDGSERGVINYGYRILPESDRCFGWRYRGDELENRFIALIPEFRAKYYSNKSPRTTKHVTVRVHIRRGDVSAEVARDMFTSTAVVARTVRGVKSSLDSLGLPYSISAHSQGNRADFEDLHALGVELFLDSDAIWTMQELIEADVLIMARSSFSHYAGLVSDGIKIYDGSNAWAFLPPTGDWIPCDGDGAFDPAVFERQLTLLLQAKEKAMTTGSSLISQ
jgi:hypothetical protein